MRRVAFVVLMATCGLLLVQAPASAKCLVLPFDTAVRQAQVVWWGTVTGTDYKPPTTTMSSASVSGWTLKVRLQDVLKGPGSVGETRLAMPARCTATPFFSQKAAERYVGQTLLFIGHFYLDVLVPAADVLTPQGLSPQQQFQRALNDLGLQRTPSPSPLAPLAAGGFPLWAIIVLAALVVVVAVGSFVVARRRRTSRPVG